MKRPDLARTFSIISNQGKKGFYEGEIAEKFIEAMARNEGFITFDDFKNYRATFVDPLELKIKNAKLFNLPPPPQGLASILILGLLDELSITCKKV